VRHGEVQLSVIPEFNLGLDVDHSLTSSLSKRDGSDLLRRDDIIGGFDHSIKYDASFSGLNRLVWNSGGVDLQVDSLFKSFVSSGENRIAAWRNDETAGEVFGDQPGAVRLHRQGSSESGKAPRFRNRITPAIIFRTDVLTCTEDENGRPICSRVSFCEDGSLVCDEETAVSRPKRTSSSVRRSTHPHQHHQRSGHVRRGLLHDEHAHSSAHDMATKDILEKREPTGASGSVRPAYKAECKVCKLAQDSVRAIMR
jgi:hypothetical protein